jgi:CRP-like cAMP-binding protein
MNQVTSAKMLKDIQFLRGAPPDDLEQIASVADICDYRKSETVFREGEAAESIYLVVSGKLSLELSPSTIYHKYLVDVGPGEMLGWSSLVEDSCFVATAVVAENARLVRIDAARLRAICENDPEFGYEFMRRTMLALGKRLTATWSRLANVYLAHYAPITAQNDERNL